jgi:hypothetical protein
MSDEIIVDASEELVLDELIVDVEAEVEVEVPEAPPMRRLYFINEIVEWNLTQYIWTGCTRVELRDEIMSHATELIRQIIRKQGLHTIYPGAEESAFGDLLQTAWCQLERTLYKYRSRPHCRNCFNPDRPSDSLLYDPPPKQYGIITIDDVVEKIDKCPICNVKFLPYPYVLPKQGLYGGTETIIFRGMSKVFNMWSQIARTVILAYIKKEGRDRKNGHNYMNHLGSRNKSQNNMIERFILEARQLSKYNDDFLKIIETLELLVKEDDKPHDGLIGKLVDKSGLSRAIITNWFKYIKYQSFDFTDSPVNRIRGEYKNDRKKVINDEEDFG